MLTIRLLLTARFAILLTTAGSVAASGGNQYYACSPQPTSLTLGIQYDNADKSAMTLYVWGRRSFQLLRKAGRQNRSEYETRDHVVSVTFNRPEHLILRIWDVIHECHHLAPE